MKRLNATVRRVSLGNILLWLSVLVITLEASMGAVQAAFTQASYRFSINLDAANPSALTSNPTATDDTIRDSVIDVDNGVFYVVGGTASSWVIEKRSELHGSGISGFGSSGQIISDPSANTDEMANAVAVDSVAGHVYIAGYDRSPGLTNAQWRIEKRRASDGTLCTVAICGFGFDSDGILTSDPTTGNDIPLSIILDKAGGFVYIAGYDSANGNQGRIEKRLMTSGALVAGFGTGGVYTFNLSNGDEKIRMIDIDPEGEYLYVSGVDEGNGNTQWRLQKQRTSDAALCSTVALCGTVFGTGGIYTSNPSSRGDVIASLQVDSAGGAIYLGGYDGAPGNNNNQWRVEKINLETGTLITGFGTGGVVSSNPSGGNDDLVDMDLDGAGGYIFLIGTDATSNYQWRIEKRRRIDGQLCSSIALCGTVFGTGGVLTSNPSANDDLAVKVMIDVDRSFLWGLGGDRTNGLTDSRWRIEQYQLDDGDYWLSAQDNVATASTNISFRIRLLLHTDTSVIANTTNFKLQSAIKAGTCDTGFIGETYTDVTNSSGDILYYDNPTLADGVGAVAVTGEPIHSGHTRVLQTIEEVNNFTNPNAILLNQDGAWDLVLRDNFAFGAYCFRAVNSDGTFLGTYSVVPEITFCKDLPKTEGLLRHGTYFCEGIKKQFFWAG
jgi:hypothetical protein